jgi:hypothetical protein
MDRGANGGVVGTDVRIIFKSGLLILVVLIVTNVLI